MCNKYYLETNPDKILNASNVLKHEKTTPFGVVLSFCVDVFVVVLVLEYPESVFYKFYYAAINAALAYTDKVDTCVQVA